MLSCKGTVGREIRYEKEVELIKNLTDLLKSKMEDTIQKGKNEFEFFSQKEIPEDFIQKCREAKWNITVLLKNDAFHKTCYEYKFQKVKRNRTKRGFLKKIYQK